MAQFQGFAEGRLRGGSRTVSRPVPRRPALEREGALHVRLVNPAGESIWMMD